MISSKKQLFKTGLNLMRMNSKRMPHLHYERKFQPIAYPQRYFSTEQQNEFTTPTVYNQELPLIEDDIPFGIKISPNAIKRVK